MTSGLVDTIRGATLIGFRNSVLAAIYTLQKARLDAQADARPDDAGGREHGPGTVRSADEVAGGLRVRFDEAVLQVRLTAAGGVFVGWAPADGSREERPPGPTPSYAVLAPAGVAGPGSPAGVPGPGSPAGVADVEDDAGWWADDVTVREVEDGWELGTPPLTVRLAVDGTLTFAADGAVLRTDDPPTWRGREWRHRTRLTPSDAVFGLGGRSTRPNRHGTFRLWNSESGGSWTEGSGPLSITMPMYVAVRDAGCALAFYDNAFDGEAHVDDAGVRLRMYDGPLRYHIVIGGLAEVFRGYAELTGKPTLPPRWMLGYHQAKWGYDSAREVRSVVAEFRRRELPLSGVWLDIDHLKDRAVFTVDPERFGDLPELAEQLASDGVHLVPIVDPGVPDRRGNQVYESGLARGAFCRDVNGNVARAVVWPGVTVFPDFTSPRSRDWWGEQYATYTDAGIGAFWQDMNEPSAFVAWGDPTLPLSTRHELDGEGGDHREAHNIYGLQMNRAAYESVSELRPGRRPWIVSRSGWVGMHRYGGAWSGDVASSWEGLRASLWFTVGLSMSGVSFSGPDIGGFDGHPGPELFARWFQMASCLPFFRTHSSFRTPRREPWQWPEDVQPVLRAALDDRYALLPYWYTMAHQASRTGVPYVRPLCWADPSDPELREVDDAFLLGDALLVAPVVGPGVSERAVRLPAGRWYDRRDGTVYEGPGEVMVPAELRRPVPVLVRAGAVLPVHDGPAADAGRPRPVVLEAYRSGDRPADGPGGELVTDAGNGWKAPVVERFAIDGERVTYDGPAESLPYDVRWIGA